MRLLYTLLVLGFLHTSFFLAAQNANPEKIAKKLLDEMAERPQSYHAICIVMADRVDLDALDALLSAQRALPDLRSETVISALKTKAAESQANLLNKIKDTPEVVVSGTVASYWAANAIFAEMKTEMIEELSNRSDVAWIGLNGKPQLEAFTVTPAPPVSMPNGHEKGLTVIGAPEMWAMGYTGYGQLALTNDTGVDPTQAALNTSYRGNTAPPEQSFFSYDNSAQIQLPGVDAFDCQYHGTHVTGTILGLDRPNNDTIGVAFNGQWMGAASLNVCGGNTQNLIAAFQWAIDPDGNPATSDDMADVINNSWYDPSIDTLDCFSVYVPIVQAMEAAGMAVVFSAGNAGPNPSTITPPHNINLNLVNSFTVGALNGNSNLLPIADFSSRGPSKCISADSSLLIKPEVSAPGVDVRSCMPSGYGLLSGTSMASPHVSGAIMLLKEAFPNLPGKEFKLALYFTATDLGDPGEDNTFGMGLINLPAAFDYLVAQGNVPVSPFVDNDVFVVSMEMPAVTCASEINPILITVENGGSAPLTSFDIKLQAGAASLTTSWSGNLAQGQRTQIQLPVLQTSPGDYHFKVTLLNPNGVVDERPLNNSIERVLQVLDKPRLQVQVEGNATACEGASVLLRAEYDGPGYASVKWYNEPFATSPIAQGMVYATAPLTQADTFYAQASYVLPVGLTNKNNAPNELLEDEDIGLVFDAYVPFKLKSVKVYAVEPGLRQFILMDANGNEIEHSVVNVSTVGEYNVPVNWEVPAGTGFQILKKGGKDFYGNTSGISYPMVQPGVAAITGTTLGDDAYYFFYNWQIEIQEVCERTEIIVPVNAGGSSPGASFSLSTNNLDLASNTPVQFTNTSTGGVASFDWNFGDGAGSNLENPTHTYTEAGIFIVSLAITSADGCSAFALDTIQVTSNELSIANPGQVLPENVAVYPNPASQTVNVQLDLHHSKVVQLQLSDMTGKLVRSSGRLALQKDLLQMDIADLTTGVYFLTVKMEGENSVWKVVKI